VRKLVKLVLLGVAGLALGAAGFALAGTTTLSMTYAGPGPSTLTVPWGDTLRITNVDSISHALISSHSELRTGLVAPGKTFSATITGPAHSYGYRQTGGRGYPGKLVIDFTGDRVSMSASAPAVGFGHAVRLSGTASVHSMPVAIEFHRAGDAHWTTLTTVVSSSTGDYSASVRLDRGGKLRASMAGGQIRSSPKVVEVRPKLTASRHGGRVVAKLAPAAAALRVTLECRIAHGRWRPIASKRPSSTGVASFATRSGHGAVRATVTNRNVRDGFAAQASRALSAAC